MKNILFAIGFALLVSPAISYSAEIDFGAKFIDIDDTNGTPRRFVSTAVINDAGLTRTFTITFALIGDSGRLALATAQFAIDQGRVVVGRANEDGRIAITYDPLSDQLRIRYALNTGSKSVNAAVSYAVDGVERRLGDVTITSALP